MADLLIRGMEMPEECLECRLADSEGFCTATQETITHWGIREDWCPLAELPPEKNRLYVCDPSKADGCSKTGCAYKDGAERGDCMLTTRLEWALMEVQTDGKL